MKARRLPGVCLAIQAGFVWNNYADTVTLSGNGQESVQCVVAVWKHGYTGWQRQDTVG
jgi:hypothetical protein